MRLVLLVLAVLMSAGCGVSLRSSLDAWHPSGRVSRLDEADRALLARMVVDTPTDDAMDAREHIDELGEVGDADVRALLVSSIAWLEDLERAGALARFRDGRCSDAPTSKQADADVIGLLSEEARPSEQELLPRLREASHLGLWASWRSYARTAACRRDLRALRALALTRAFLGARIDEHAVLDVLDLAVTRLGDGPASSCSSDDETAIRMAVTRHFFAFDPSSNTHPNETCRVDTLFGRVPTIHTRLTERAYPPAARDDATDSIGEAYDFADDLGTDVLRAGELAYQVIVDMSVTLVLYVAKRDGAWRVVGEGPHVIVG